MNRRRFFFLSLCMTLGVFVCSSPAKTPDNTGFSGSESVTIGDKDTGEKFLVMVDVGRVRADPSLEAPIRFRLKQGDAVSVFENRGDWYRIEDTHGRRGWMHQTLLARSEQIQAAAKETENESQEAKASEVPVQAEPASAEEKTTIVIPAPENDYISVNFREVEIRELISAVAIQREVNVVMSKDVSGNVSVHLNKVTLDKALDAITLAGGFTYQKQKDLYYVYKPPKVVDPQLKDLKMWAYKLKYIQIEKVQEMMDAFPELHLIKIHEPTKTVIVQDTSKNIKKIEALLIHLDAPPKQVVIEAQILEVTLNDDMTLGVDWAKLLGDASIGTGGFSTAVMPTTESVSPIPSTGTGVFGNIITAAGTSHQFTAAIDALQAQTTVDTLSAPKILAIHGKKARVQVGGKQGYRVTTVNQGISTESIEFVDTGTILEITPFINDRGDILLEVRPSIQSAEIKLGIPSTKTTDVTTWLLAKDGETVFIGGLIQDIQTRTRDMIPCLGGIPGAGLLFGRTFDGIGKSELVVLITPQIVSLEANQPTREGIEKVKKFQESFQKSFEDPHKDLWKNFDDKGK